MIKYCGEAILCMGKPAGRKPKRSGRMPKPMGGLASIEYERQLILNRNALVERLRSSPKERKEAIGKILKSRGIIGYKRVTYRSSRKFPGIEIVVEIEPERLKETKQAGVAGLHYIWGEKGGKPVEVTVVFNSEKPSEARSKLAAKLAARTKREVFRHERSHARTSIVRNPGRQPLKITSRNWLKERLLNEMTSAVEEGGQAGIFGGSGYHLDIIRSYTERLKEKYGYSEEKSYERIGPMYFEYYQKRWAISDALRELPREEVTMVLRKTKWENLEKDLSERIAVRRKYIK
jgi:hypothetical protein